MASHAIGTAELDQVAARQEFGACEKDGALPSKREVGIVTGACSCPYDQRSQTGLAPLSLTTG